MQSAWQIWSCHHTERFPLNHRFVLGERIERNLYELLETLVKAKYTRPRDELLRRANLTLEVLRFQMQLSKDLQYLRLNSYAHAGKTLDEISRLVGGWLKSSGSPCDGSATSSRFQLLRAPLFP
jgi:hypothetical protein